ncbi:MAG TPA: hypothetical protein VKT81_06235 [Bryobacteraceae bacterium]|nr:hypothetical protein [Bryobacteraceae bacterium]
MKRISFLLVLAAGGGILWAQPTVYDRGVVNADSLVPVGLPNSSIAQGSIFSVFGTNLGPAKSPGLSFPLQTTLGGTSIQVTVGGTSVAAIPLFVGPGQINAILPSKTPTGSASLVVTTAAGASAPASFNVVAHSFGINSVNQSGSGPGIVDDHNYKLVTLNSAAQAGDTVIIWGTGLGGVSGDEAAGPLPGNQPNIPVKVYIGTKPATLTYQGRSGCCAGVDQIAAQIPAGVTGCYVPVAVQIGDIVSNWVTTSIAAPNANRVCSDTNGLSASQLAAIEKVGSGSFGSINLDRSSTTSTLPPPLGTGSPQTTTSDSGSASFFKYTADQLVSSASPFQVTAIGTCFVFTFTRQNMSFPNPVAPTYLDAGVPITVKGPNGSKTLALVQKGIYSSELGGGSGPAAGPLFLDAGAYTVTGVGGADVGPFTANLTIPPVLTWTNEDSVNTVNRANGQLITWTGGDPNGTVIITGDSIQFGSNPDGSDAVGGFFTCTAPDSDHQFTIPPPVLLSLPPSSVIPDLPISLGNLSVGIGLYGTFTAKGIDVGLITSSESSGKGVTYQ